MNYQPLIKCCEQVIAHAEKAQPLVRRLKAAIFSNVGGFLLELGGTLLRMCGGIDGPGLWRPSELLAGSVAVTVAGSAARPVVLGTGVSTKFGVTGPRFLYE